MELVTNSDVMLFGRHELNLAFQLKTFRGPSVFDLVFVEVKTNALYLQPRH